MFASTVRACHLLHDPLRGSSKPEIGLGKFSNNVLLFYFFSTGFLKKYY